LNIYGIASLILYIGYLSIKYPNPDKPEPEKDQSRKHEKTKARKKANKIFVFSPPEADIFVINPPQADHKMQRIQIQHSNSKFDARH
jgi:hypothetical protein